MYLQSLIIPYLASCRRHATQAGKLHMGSLHLQMHALLSAWLPIELIVKHKGRLQSGDSDAAS